MNSFLTALGVGIIFALAGVTCLLILIGIGELLEWYERRQK